MNRGQKARIYRPTPRNISYLANRLRAGELVAVPSETVYGLAGNAFDPAACRAIFRAKGRPRQDPLIVHIYSVEQLHEIAVANPAAMRLAAKFWPGPLTLVLPKTAAISKLITAGRESVAVRMPRHPVFRRLLREAGIPLAAPSANPFGYVSPTTAEHVADNLGGRIRHILDGGPSEIGLESTIVDLRDPMAPALLRPGAITSSRLQRVVGTSVMRSESRNYRKEKPASTKNRRGQIAPGLLARHYSPRTPVRLHREMPTVDNTNEGFIYMRKPSNDLCGPNVFWFDARGKLRGIAKHLFAVLRTVDRAGFSQMHVEQIRGGELADAINDRLRRAAAS